MVLLSRGRVEASVRRFVADRRGNFAIIGALVMVPVLAIAGLALDYARLHSAQSRLQAAADAAAFAAVAAAGEPVEQLQRIAADFVAANADGMEVETETKIAGRRLDLEVRTEVATPLLSVIGASVTEIAVTASVESALPLGGGSVRREAGAGAPSAAGHASDPDYERLRQRLYKALDQLPAAERDRLARKFANILKRNGTRLAN